MFGLGDTPPCILNFDNRTIPATPNAIAEFDTSYARWNPMSPWRRAAQQFHDSMKTSCKDCPK